jgi:hypothetical protein
MKNLDTVEAVPSHDSSNTLLDRLSDEGELMLNVKCSYLSSE